MAAADTTERSHKSPLRKLVLFFQNSRDQWKAKHHELKRELKKEQNQVRAVEKSRAQWRSKAEAAEQRVEELQRELNEIKRVSRQSRQRQKVNLSKPSTADRPDMATASA
jgi:predicted ribosome quality control (RQC) complex YloA/Tae2 family protein